MSAHDVLTLVAIAIIPLVTLAAVTWLLWFGRREAESPGSRANLLRGTAQTLAFGAAAVGAQSFLLGAPTFPPADATHTTPFALIAGALLGIFAAIAARKPVRLWALLLTIALAGLMFPAAQMPQGFGWVRWALVLWSCSYGGFSYLAAMPARSRLFLPLGMYAGVCGATLIASGSLALGELCVTAAFALLGVFAAVLVRPATVTTGPMLGAYLAWLAAMLAQGCTYGDTPLPAAAALAVGAPALAFLVYRVLGSRFKRLWISSIIAGVAVLILGGAVAAWAHNATSPATPNPYGS